MRPIYFQNTLLADSITCKFIQPILWSADASVTLQLPEILYTSQYQANYILTLIDLNSFSYVIYFMLFSDIKCC